MKKKPKVWLARDESTGLIDDDMYMLSLKRPKKTSDAWRVRGSLLATMPVCSEEFECIAPKPCHLKPGEGPIEIDITIRRKK